MFEGVLGCLRVFQGVSGCFKVFQGVSGCFRVFQGGFREGVSGSGLGEGVF